MFFPLLAQQNSGQQHGFSDRQASQYGSKLYWSRDKFRLSMYANHVKTPTGCEQSIN